MTEWSHLPNARHIDRVLASLVSRPEAWAAACDVYRGPGWDTEWGVSWNAAQLAARGVGRGAAWDAAHTAAWSAAQTIAQLRGWVTARGPAWDVATDAVGALIAWDDCAVYLSTPPEAFPLLLSTTNHAAVLMYSAAIVFSKEPSC